MTVEVSVWLAPSEEEARFLKEIICNLARRYDAPVFRPHLTVAGPLRVKLTAIKERLAECGRRFAPITLEAKQVDHGPRRFEAVVIRMPNNVRLTAIRESMYALESRQQGASPTTEFRPHISLIYGELAAGKRREIVESLVLKRACTFSKIELASPGPTGDWDQIADWTILHSCPLSGSD